MRRPALVPLAALAVVLPGCGTGNSDRFNEQMTSYCRGLDEPARTLAKRTVDLNEDSGARDAAYLRRAAPLLFDGVALNEEALRRLRPVEAPDDVDRRRKDRLVGAIEAQLKLLRRAAEAAAKADIPAFRAVQVPLVDAGAERQEAVLLLNVDACLL